MAVQLPPLPNDPIGENHYWREWFQRIKEVIITTSSNFFTGLNFTGSNITSITTRNHNDLTSIQGGTAADRQHLTTAQLGYVTGVKPALYSYQTPATGFSITIPNGVDNLVLIPGSSPLATGTIIMPSTPADGQRITVSSAGVITALTVSPNTGQVLLNAPTTLQLWANTPGTISGYGFSYIYIQSITTWVRVT